MDYDTDSMCLPNLDEISPSTSFESSLDDSISSTSPDRKMDSDSDSFCIPSLHAISPSISFSTGLDRSISSTSLDRPTSVAIIGCGPGGMSFLHAVAMRRKKLEDDGDLEALVRLPVVTCFERSSSPGGVWRNSDVSEVSSSYGTTDNASNSSPNMYEGLWINCHKEAMEFADYTFDDHFEGPLPVYLPRKQILEYMLARVTSKEDIFQYVNFNTTVQSVTYDEQMNEFTIMTVDKWTEESTTNRFDKCIWAGGLNGKPNFAPSIIDVFARQNFHGQVVHSADMGALTSSVKGKRIMMIGDSYSAEDLALQCIKLGAEKIFITTRNSCGIASYMGAWPADRVEILYYQMPHGVTADGNGIICKDNRTSQEQNQLEGNSVTIEDISIVIFCTGYAPNLDFLEPELRYAECKNPEWSVPKDWKMSKNTLSSIIGDVEPSTKLDGSTWFMNAGLYRNLLISNPNMMFLFEVNSYPIMNIDVSAWLCLSYICGDIEVPAVEVMKRENSLQLLQEMQQPWVRYYMDKNYSDKYDEKYASLPDDHWHRNCGSESYLECSEEYGSYEIRHMARDMKTCNYPLNLGSYEKLNRTGEKLNHMTVMGSAARYQLTSESEDESWRTFRDCDPGPFSSLMTDTKATCLQGRWMDIDDEGKCISE